MDCFSKLAVEEISEPNTIVPAPSRIETFGKSLPVTPLSSVTLVRDNLNRLFTVFDNFVLNSAVAEWVVDGKYSALLTKLIALLLLLDGFVRSASVQR